MKRLASLLIVFILLTSSVLAGNFSVSSLTITGANPGSTATGTFTLQNLDNRSLSSFTFIPSQLIFTSAISFTPSTLGTLPQTSTSSISTNIVTSSTQVPGTYTGQINVTDSEGTTQLTPVSLTVRAAPQLSITQTLPLRFSGESGEDVSRNFALKNTGNVDLSNILFETLNFTNRNANITFSFNPSSTTLTKGQEKSISATAHIDDDAEIGVYSGSVVLKDSFNPAANTTLSFEVSVQPEVCEDGVVGDLTLDIREPDNGDDFKPGDDINLEVKVSNSGNDNLDVIVEAFLYNINEDEEVERALSEVSEIEDGRSKTFEFTLSIPLEDLSDEDEYQLFVKAYEDGQEDDHCNEKSVNVDLKRENDKVVINQFILTPLTVSCGDSFDAVVDLENIGTRSQDDVTVRIIETALDIDLVDPHTYELEEFDKDDNDATIRFNGINVPSSATAGTYSLEAQVEYKDGREKESKTSTLTVVCGIPSGETQDVALELLKTSFELSKDVTSISLPVKVTNTGTTNQQFSVEITNINEWAQTSVTPKTVFIRPGQSDTVYFLLKAQDDLDAGMYSGTVALKSDDTLVETTTFVVEITEDATKPILGNFKDLFSDSKIFWIVLDVILVILAIFFIKLIFSKGKKKKDEDVEVNI